MKEMHRLLRILSSMSFWERMTLLGFALLFTGSVLGLLRVFYLENTVLMPAMGGTYIEGTVGDLQPLNPWFTVRNDVNRDIVSLVFSGLLRYNPQTRKIEEDLATLEVSQDGRRYILRLKENLFWHDSTPKAPHPVTADDVLFTFQTIQDPAFPNKLLQQNFRGVEMKKLDSRGVQFELSQAYSFFPSNLTLGLLPKASFEGIPVGRVDLASDFGFHPVGSGPYRLKQIVQTDLSTEVTLERFDRPGLPPYRLDRIVFRVFPEYSSLLSDLRNLQGVRLVPRNAQGEPMIPKRFEARQYTLPQYVAAFFNLDRPALQDRNLRLGLQRGTDKQVLAETVRESVLVDTPLLEIDMSDWRYQFDPAAAQGALFESNWNMPEKLRLQRLLEDEDTNRTGVLRAPAVALLATGASLTLTGSLADAPLGSKINGIPVVLHPTATGAWIAALPAVRGSTGALAPGRTMLRLTNPRGKVLDSAYVFRAKNAAEEARAREEQNLLHLYLQSKGTALPAGQRVTVQQLFLENGMLRRRRPGDPVNVRRNLNGDPLVLRLLTSSTPPEYRKAAEFLRASWAELGVKVVVEIPETRDAFQERLLRRDYDVLLFGQSLLDNLDSFSYWHSSGVQKRGEDERNLLQDAYNLSQYVSPQADQLLEKVRRTKNDGERSAALQELQEVLKRDVPALFLYSPLYTYAHHRDIQGVEMSGLTLHSDRFLTLQKWYVRQERIFRTGKSWVSFLPWLPSLFARSTASQ